MIKSRTGMRTSLLGAGALAFALLNAGCGGTSTEKSSAVPTSPYSSGISNATGGETSGLNLPATPAVPYPSAGDTAYYTYATAITPLNGAPAINPNSFGPGPTVPLGGAAPAGQAGVTFRADIAVGQLADGSIPAITGATLTSTDPEWTLGSLPLTFQYDLNTADGPYVNATYTTAAFTLPFTTQGAHTLAVTVTDKAGRSTETDYVVQVVAAPDISVSINSVDTGAKDPDTGKDVFATLAEGDTATLTPATGTAQTVKADSSGTAFFFITPGKYTLTVDTTDDDGKPVTYMQALDLTDTGSYAQVKKRAGLKMRPAIKAHH